jgi:hypothetical protein
MGEDAAQVIVRRSRLQALIRVQHHVEEYAQEYPVDARDLEHLGDLIEDARRSIPGGEPDSGDDDE